MALMVALAEPFLNKKYMYSADEGQLPKILSQIMLSNLIK